jgi:hypothetical protein
MAALSKFAAVWRNLVHRNQVERDLDEEVRVHLELLVDERIRAGMSPDDARRAAALETGGVEAVKEHVRDVRAGAIAEQFLQDIHYAARQLRRDPLFTLTAALSLAIGIGANTTIFTVANALLFRPPAGVVEPARLVDIGVTRGDGSFNPGSYPNYVDVRSRSTTLDGVYAYTLFPQAMSLDWVGHSTASTADRVFGTFVTTN